MKPQYDWKWHRKHGSFLQFSKKIGNKIGKIGTVALYERLEMYEWITVYRAYLGGQRIGSFNTMREAKDAVREAYAKKTKGTKEPYIRRACKKGPINAS